MRFVSTAASFGQFAVQMEHVVTSSPFVQVVHILSDDFDMDLINFDSIFMSYLELFVRLFTIFASIVFITLFL